jgi:catechol 2,3-dioxygenase-like lactoylglutathione lyase family enzyme
MRPLIRLLTATFVPALLTVVTVSAQTTLPYDHVHLAAPDQPKAVEWYQKNFGGETTPEGKDRLFYGKTRFIWMKSEAAKPSRDSAIDHIAFSVADLDGKIRDLQTAGVKVTLPIERVPNVGRRAMVEDPWGVAIEVIDDAAAPGFHHVHLASTNPDSTLAWFKERFGGERAKYKNTVDGLKYGDVWVFVRKIESSPAPSAGHAVDHVGWRVQNLEKTLEDLRGIKVLQGVTNLQLATGPIKFSFVEDPAGTKIELVQR